MFKETISIKFTPLCCFSILDRELSNGLQILNTFSFKIGEIILLIIEVYLQSAIGP